jgi:8-hydroxy-5-deazaflavin:NADPH oxidoreductase
VAIRIQCLIFQKGALKRGEMSYKNFVSMNIAIIGSGEIAETYGISFSIAGHEVYMACKDGDAGIRPSLALLENVHMVSIEQAAQLGDFIIIATPPKDVREVSYWLGDVRRKVIIDVTCNVYSADDEVVNTVSAIRAITGSPHVVKTFNAIGFQRFMKPIFRTEKVELILAGESRKAKEITKIIARELGINHYYDFGGDDTIPLLHEMAKCLHKLAANDNSQNKTLIARY